MVRGEFWEEKQRKDQEYTLFDSSIGFIKCCYHMPGSMYYRLHFHLPEQAWVCPAAAKSLQSCDPIDGSPPGSPVPGILQARTLEWVAISFSNAWKWKVKVKSLSRVRLLVTPWTAAHQAPPSMGFSRQEYWSGVPLPSPCFAQGHAVKLVARETSAQGSWFHIRCLPAHPTHIPPLQTVGWGGSGEEMSQQRGKQGG